MADNDVQKSVIAPENDDTEGQLKSILEAMKHLEDDDDYERAHLHADGLVCRALEILGQVEQHEVVEVPANES